MEIVLFVAGLVLIVLFARLEKRLFIDIESKVERRPDQRSGPSLVEGDTK